MCKLQRDANGTLYVTTEKKNDDREEDTQQARAAATTGSKQAKGEGDAIPVNGFATKQQHTTTNAQEQTNGLGRNAQHGWTEGG